MKRQHKPPILFNFSVVVALLLILALVAHAQSFSNTVTAGIENFGKVNDNYYRGSQPDAAQFAELKRLGIKTIVDLRKDSVAESAGWARTAGLNYVNIPLTTKQAATPAQIEYFLKLVNDQANCGSDFVAALAAIGRSQKTTSIGLLRKAMIFRDVDKYFKSAWKRHWQSMSSSTAQLVENKYGKEKLKEISKLLNKPKSRIRKEQQNRKS